MAAAASQARRSSGGGAAPASPTRRMPASPAALTMDQQRDARRRFYGEAAQQLSRPAVSWRSPWDQEIGLLFAPALIAG